MNHEHAVMLEESCKMMKLTDAQVKIIMKVIDNEIYLYEMLTTNFLQAMLVKRTEQSH